MTTKIVVGVFPDRVHAARAVDKLVEWGFVHDNIAVTALEPAADVPETRVSDTAQDHEAIGSRITDFFNRVFGFEGPHEDAQYYAHAVRRGRVMVSVTTGSDEGADKAADIMNDHAALAVEEEAPAEGTPDSALPTGTRHRAKGPVRIYHRP